jgi:hypothetical protein
VELDLDDIFPERSSLIGLQFATDADYERAAALLPAWDFDLYRELYPGWRMIVLRRTDAHRLTQAGLPYTEIQQRDPDELPPEVMQKRYQDLIDYWRPRIRERLQRGG